MDNHNPPGIDDADVIIVAGSNWASAPMSDNPYADSARALDELNKPVRATVVVNRDEWAILERFNRKDMRILERMLRGD